MGPEDLELTIRIFRQALDQNREKLEEKRVQCAESFNDRRRIVRMPYPPESGKFPVGLWKAATDTRSG